MDAAQLTPLLPNPVGTGSRSNETLEAASSASADFESFLTLLTAQLENQDPLAPLDSTEFIAQLASFSTVEQQIGTNERLDQIADQSFNRDIAGFAAWIGKAVATSDGRFNARGEQMDFGLASVDGAETATAVIKDSLGNTIRTLPVALDGSEAFSWDGKNNDGEAIFGEDFSATVDYFGGGSVLDTLPALVRTEVLGIRGSEDGVKLDLSDGRRLSPNDVVSVSDLALTS
ncbi:MAG: flagellar hook capping FlgD N-terminal domain-containing protein [Pseudomonadota bacterium]